MPNCQYCGNPVAAPTHKTCQACNVVIAQANCDGVIKQVMDTAEAMKTRDDLSPQERLVTIQDAYEKARA